MEQLAPRWEGWHAVPNSGHWVQYEAAEALNPLLLQVLA
jgi:pimeloyl-ACP methyl ester carboxylesterase